MQQLPKNLAFLKLLYRAAMQMRVKCVGNERASIPEVEFGEVGDICIHKRFLVKGRPYAGNIIGQFVDQVGVEYVWELILFAHFIVYYTWTYSKGGHHYLPITNSLLTLFPFGTILVLNIVSKGVLI